MAKPLLDLSAVTERQPFVLPGGGKTFEMLNPFELSPFQATQLEKFQAAMHLDKSRALTAAEEKAQRAALIGAVGIIAPEVPAKTRSFQKTAILLALYLTFLGLIEGGGEGNPPIVPTGDG